MQNTLNRDCQACLKKNKIIGLKQIVTGINLGSLISTQLLQKLKSAATWDISENLMKTLLLEKLLDSIRNIIFNSNGDCPSWLTRFRI